MAEYVVVDKEQLESDLMIVADSIREKANVTEDLAFPSEFKSVVESIDTSKPEQEKTISITENGITEVTPDDGKVLSKVTVNVDVESGGGSCGDNQLKYATNMNEIYRSAVFPTDYELLVDVPNFLEGMDRIIRYAKGLKSIKLVGNTNNNTASMQYAFQQYANDTLLEIIDFSEWGNGEIKVTYGNSAFNSCTKLHTINGVFDFTNAVNVNAIFDECRDLKNITFKNNTLNKSIRFKQSNLLSDASIQSIIDGLATVETSQTLTLHADVKAKLTDTQLATITGKNWTLA